MTSFSSGHQQRRPEPNWKQDPAPLRYALDEFEAYFAGEPVEFTASVELDGTPFQRSVWEALLTLPYGSTTSYGEIAQTIGRPKAARAVGSCKWRQPASRDRSLPPRSRFRSLAYGVRRRTRGERDSSTAGASGCPSACSHMTIQGPLAGSEQYGEFLRRRFGHRTKVELEARLSTPAPMRYAIQSR